MEDIQQVISFEDDGWVGVYMKLRKGQLSEEAFQEYMRCGEVDIFGQFVTRHRREFPYSFNAYAIYRHPDFLQRFKNNEINTLYEDRIYLEPKYRECVDKLVKKYGSSYDYQNVDMIGELLSLFFDKKVQIMGIEVDCNRSNGNTIRMFHYIDV